MKRSQDQGHAIAAQFEHIVMPNSDGCYTNKLYAVEGRIGVFKRLPMDSCDTTGSFKAWFDGGFIRLVAAEGVQDELVEAMQIGKEDTTPLFRRPHEQDFQRADRPP